MFGFASRQRRRRANLLARDASRLVWDLGHLRRQEAFERRAGMIERRCDEALRLDPRCWPAKDLLRQVEDLRAQMFGAAGEAVVSAPTPAALRPARAPVALPPAFDTFLRLFEASELDDGDIAYPSSPALAELLDNFTAEELVSLGEAMAAAGEHLEAGDLDSRRWVMSVAAHSLFEATNRDDFNGDASRVHALARRAQAASTVAPDYWLPIPSPAESSSAPRPRKPPQKRHPAKQTVRRASGTYVRKHPHRGKETRSSRLAREAYVRAQRGY